MFVDLSMTYSHLSSSHSSSLYQYTYSAPRDWNPRRYRLHHPPAILPWCTNCRRLSRRLSELISDIHRWWFPPTIRYIRPMVKGNSSSQLPLDGLCKFPGGYRFHHFIWLLSNSVVWISVVENLGKLRQLCQRNESSSQCGQTQLGQTQFMDPAVPCAIYQWTNSGEDG